jgi:hypothetical protein
VSGTSSGSTASTVISVAVFGLILYGQRQVRAVQTKLGLSVTTIAAATRSRPVTETEIAVLVAGLLGDAVGLGAVRACTARLWGQSRESHAPGKLVDRDAVALRARRPLRHRPGGAGSVRPACCSSSVSPSAPSDWCSSRAPNIPTKSLLARHRKVRTHLGGEPPRLSRIPPGRSPASNAKRVRERSQPTLSSWTSRERLGRHRADACFATEKAGVFGSSAGIIDDRLAIARHAYKRVRLLAALAA